MCRSAVGAANFTTEEVLPLPQPSNVSVTAILVQKAVEHPDRRDNVLELLAR